MVVIFFSFRSTERMDLIYFFYHNTVLILFSFPISEKFLFIPFSYPFCSSSFSLFVAFYYIFSSSFFLLSLFFLLPSFSSFHFTMSFLLPSSYCLFLFSSLIQSFSSSAFHLFLFCSGVSFVLVQFFLLLFNFSPPPQSPYWIILRISLASNFEGQREISFSFSHFFQSWEGEWVRE